MRALAIMLLLLSCMQGCGRKGPLHLPQAQAGPAAATHSPSVQDVADHD